MTTKKKENAPSNKTNITYPKGYIIRASGTDSLLPLKEEDIVPLGECFEVCKKENGIDFPTYELVSRCNKFSSFNKKGLLLGYYDNEVDFVIVRDEEDALILVPVRRK